MNIALQLYLKNVRLEDVMPQLHCLLTIQFPLLAGQHEGDESVAAPES